MVLQALPVSRVAGLTLVRPRLRTGKGRGLSSADALLLYIMKLLISLAFTGIILSF
jgi:hypothetical protein